MRCFNVCSVNRRQEQNSFHSTISLTHRLQLNEKRVTRIETTKKRRGHSHTFPGQRTCYCCYGQEALYRKNGLTSKWQSDMPTLK